MGGWFALDGGRLRPLPSALLTFTARCRSSIAYERRAKIMQNVYRHNVTQILPVEIDLVDVGFQRQIKRERVVVNDAIFDVI